MADFDLAPDMSGNIHIVDWSDDVNGQPKRLNTLAIPPRYLRVGHDSPFLPTTITINSIVSGATAPVDGALGGRLFQWWWGQVGGGAPPSLVPPAAHSSTVSILFSTSNIGTWLLTGYRQSGGSVTIGLSVETSP